MKNKLIILVVLLSLSLFLNSNFWNKNISEQQAISIVKNLPEVNAYFNLGTQNAKPFIKAEDRKNNYWYVQVAEVVEDTEVKDMERTSHTATFNWYKIDRNSGDIICSMFYYDKNGKLIKDKVSSCK